MTRILRIPLLALALALCAAPMVEAQYLIQQTINAGYNPWIKGQTFTPQIGITPDPGPVLTLDLTDITLYRSQQPWFGPTSNFYLNIYDANPITGGGQFVGSSSNAIDVAPLGNMAPMKWLFDDLTLKYTHEYWALVSSTNTTGGLDVYCGMRESGGTDPYVGGTSIAGITTDYAGYHVKPTIDLAFDIMLKDTGWTNLGNDLPGALGSPNLTGQGALAAGNTVTLTLGNAAPNSTSGLFIGATSVSLPFYGGILVPAPNILLVIPTGPAGTYTLSTVYPSGVPVGFPLYLQVWIIDITGPQGFTASNAITATTQ